MAADKPLGGHPCCSAPIYVSATVDSRDALFSASSLLGDEDISEERSSIASEREIKEAMGWRLDAVARGVAVMGAAVFVSTALLKLANEAAGCYEPEYGDDYVPQECQGRVYGMRPSSLLTNIVLAVSLLSALVMPLIGSIIDHTKYRRTVGRTSAAVVTICILLQISILERAWFVAAILQIVIAFSYMVHLCTTYAYLPELTSKKEALVDYAAQFFAAQYIASVSFLIFMVGVLSFFGVAGGEELRAARLSQAIVFAICTICFGYAWTYLFGDRPASHQVPEDSTLLTAGFRKLFKTSQTILSHHCAIKWFLLSVAFAESALTAFSSIAITYMTHHLSFSAKENGIAILLLQVCSVPGTRIAAVVSNRINPIRSLQACLAVWVITTSAAAYALDGGGQQMKAYFFAVVWGLCIGWIYPTEKALYCTIIPKGQEAELMGMYICACSSLSWLPPLVFSAMNEAGISMRFGLFTVNIYLVISYFILFLVGSYDMAVAHAKHFDEALEEMEIDVGICIEEKHRHDFVAFTPESRSDLTYS